MLARRSCEQHSAACSVMGLMVHQSEREERAVVVSLWLWWAWERVCQGWVLGDGWRGQVQPST